MPYIDMNINIYVYDAAKKLLLVFTRYSTNIKERSAVGCVYVFVSNSLGYVYGDS